MEESMEDITAAQIPASATLETQGGVRFSTTNVSTRRVSSILPLLRIFVLFPGKTDDQSINNKRKRHLL